MSSFTSKTLAAATAWILLSMLSNPVAAASEGGWKHEFHGGVSLRYPNTSCPHGSYFTGTSFQDNCCPNGENAPTLTGYCCPTETDCRSKVVKEQKCADDRWTYCFGKNNTDYGFCCLRDWVCYEQLPEPGNGGGFACGPPGYKLQSSQVPVPTVEPWHY